MLDYSSLTNIVFDAPRKWITDRFQRGHSWEEIKNTPSTNSTLEEFLLRREDEDCWPHISVPTWLDLIDQQREAYLRMIEADIRRGQALVIDGTSNNVVYTPDGEHSCWQQYKLKLLSNGFAEETVGEIERATLKILRRLSADTTNIDPIKGLVIGNVQSGKTANMAALMAMAADWGWNMFIVLSGTIDNLRIQTQNRLLDDLNTDGSNLTWICLEHLSKSSPAGSRAQDLHFNESSRTRYFTVSLKNASRLSKLIQWLQKDRNKAEQMKIIVIDDEADQAGINTAAVDSNERKKINKLICSLANGLTENAGPCSFKYKAMNYIGYTATPYANILNESSRESLYPRNFIATLSVSKEYFGPQQIFGIPDGNYNGLEIIRTVSDDDLDSISNIHNGIGTEIPDSLKDSICWFICCVAARRLNGHKKPISMLIHTSQRVQHHANLSSAIESWFNSCGEKLTSRCKVVWENETVKFTIDQFKEQYSDYGLIDDLNDYPPFESIEKEIKDIISVQLRPTYLNDEGEITYHQGIHLCVDNSSNNGINDENEYLRLIYPDKGKELPKAPAFLVIGGATLSRGLTIEGLVSTFFLRSVRQADTLMQMGRWFGYRRGYELYPRIWLTDNTQRQFEYLAILDQELRDEIHMMEVRGLRPDEYAARVRNTPRLQFIRITAKNRMQSAIDAEMDFSGSFNQTYLFDNDKMIQETNLAKGKRFIESLGTPAPRKECNPHSANAAVWYNVSFKEVEKFLLEFKFCNRLSVFNDINILLSWVRQLVEEGKLTNWNVVFAGKKNITDDNVWELTNCKIAKVNRTRKSTIPSDSGTEIDVLNIGVLRAPTDILADVDLDGQPQQVKDMFIHIDETKVKEIRMNAGLSSTPQLLLYCVDKDSQPLKESQRKPLNAPSDLLGICINIPGGRIGTSYVAKVCVRLDPVFIDDTDLDVQDNDL